MTTTQAANPAGTRTLLVVAAIIVTVLAWASAFVVIRGVAPYFSGGALALGRLLVGAVALAPIFIGEHWLVGRHWVRPTAREWLSLVVIGITWFGVYNVALNIAEQTLDAGTASMIVNIGPILIALGAGLFLGEGVPRWLAIGAGVAFGGVVLIALGTGAVGFGDGTGVLWALLAAVTYTIGVLFQKPLLRRIPGGQLTLLACVVGVIFCLPFAGSLVTELANAPAGAVAGVVYLGVVPTALAFSTWAYALTHMPAGRLGVTTYVVPALVVLMGLVAFGEIPAPLAIVGGIACLAGVAVSRRRPSQPPKVVSEPALVPVDRETGTR